MKVQTQLLVIEILNNLLKRYKKDLKSEPARRYRFFMNKDLAQTLVILKHGDLIVSDDLDSNAYLDIVLNEYHLIRGLISLWESSLEPFNRKVSPAQEYLNASRIILGNDSHHLHSKPQKEWDSYDIANAFSLLYKSGLSKTVYVAKLDSSMLEIENPNIKKELIAFSQSVFDSQDDLHVAGETIATTYLIAVAFKVEEQTILQPLF